MRKFFWDCPKKPQIAKVLGEGGRLRRGAISVKTSNEGGETVRFLLVDGAIESACYTVEGRRNELYSPYLRQLAYAFSIRPQIERTLLLGGGGFAYPKFYISHYPGKSMDVVEISRKMVALSRELFYLDELLAEQGMKWGDVLGGGESSATADRAAKDSACCMRDSTAGHGVSPAAGGDGGARLHIYIEDALSYLLRCSEQYDFIVNDVFLGRRASGGLLTEDGVRLARSRLTQGGIYAVNVATAESGPLALRGRAVERLLKRHFRYVAVIPCDETRMKWEPQNCLMFASDMAM